MEVTTDFMFMVLGQMTMENRALAAQLKAANEELANLKKSDKPAPAAR